MGEFPPVPGWQDGTADDGPGPDHPAGEIQLVPGRQSGLRAAVLSGLTTAITIGIAVTAVIEPGTTAHTGHG
jgi:hypothetical protein